MPRTALIATWSASEEGLETRLGGRPLAPASLAWPACGTCAQPMQFNAQLRLRHLAPELPDGLMLLFQCVSDPGGCMSWYSEGGANAAVRVPIDVPLVLHRPPSNDHAPCTLGAITGVVERDLVGADYFAVTDGDRAVVGGFGGEPAWLQADETPDCRCGVAMRFVAQLEARLPGMDFGDAGCGYVFACAACDHEARWLWQCC